MSSPHPSSFDLDAVALGAMDPAEAERTQAHVAGCETCRQRVQARDELRSHFAATVVPRTLPKVRERITRPGWTWLSWRWLAAPAAVATALLLFALPRPPAAPVLEIKGGAGLQLYDRHAGVVRLVPDGAVLAAGDQLRLAVEPGGLTQLLVVSVDGAGQPNVYFPYGGTMSAALDASLRVELPDSLTLDATPGPERIFALFSMKPISVAEVLPGLRALAEQGAPALRSQTRLPVTVERQASVWFEKGAP